MTEEPSTETSASGDIVPGLDGGEPVSRATTIRRVVVRIVVIIVVLGVSSWALFRIFDDLDWGEVRDTLRELTDAEWLSLTFGWLVWVAAQGALTASLVDKLPVRRGVLASLGPTAVSSIIPGPSDLPVRYGMYQSWGVSPSAAATAVAASGIFSVSSQLILPAIAGILILVADVPLGGFLSVIVTASVALAVLVVIAGFTLGSAKRTEAAGRRLDGIVRRAMARLKKPELDENLGTFLAEKRADAFDHLSGKWLPTTGATILTIATKCALLVMALRFVGIPEEALGWIAIFAVYGLVAGLTAIPITPGSAGVAEIGFVGMLTAAAGDEWVNQITAGVLLYRLMTWLLIIPVGFGALGVWRHGVRADEQTRRGGVIGSFAIGAGAVLPVLSSLLAEIGDTDCELLGDGNLAQPVNAITSFAYVAVGLIIAVLVLRRRGPRWESLLFAVLLAAVGLGSVAFHGPQPGGARLMHDLPILLTAVFMLVHDLRTLWPGTPRWVLPIAFLAATALAVASADAGVAATGIVLGAVAMAEVVIYRRHVRPQALARQRHAYVAIVIVFAAGAASWLLGRSDSPACDPDSVLQLHGLWHVLSAIAFGAWWWLALGSAAEAQPQGAHAHDGAGIRQG